MQHGPTAARNRATLTERGIRNIPAYLYPPPELPGVGPWLSAFFELATDRRFVGGPIPWTSIAAYPVAPDEADLFRRCIRDADAAYLEWANRPPDKREAPMPMLPGGAFK